jgi:3-oxoacyl-[acyl-carrier-protein] synthase I
MPDMTLKSDSHSIVVTGIGALTANGHSAQDSFSNILTGTTGIAPIQRWDVADWEFKLGGEIKNYDAARLIEDRKLLKLISRQDVVGLNAVKQALQDSHLLKWRESLTDNEQKDFNERTGVFVASPGNRFEQQYDFLPVFANAGKNLENFGEKIFDHVHPMWLLRILPNNVLAYTGIQYGFKGVNENIVNHAISGTQAIAEACRFLRQGLIDRAVVVAYECAVEPESQIYYGSLGTLSATGLKAPLVLF